MIIEFEENIKEDIKIMVLDLESKLENIKPTGIEKFEEITLSINSNEFYQCEIIFGSTIRISQKTIEILWSLNYAHLYFYEHFCKGVLPEGQTITLNEEKWGLIIPQLEWAVNNLNGINSDFSESFNRDFKNTNSYGLISGYSLLFFISHELFHTLNSKKFNEILEEENQCDFDATMFIINALSDIDYIERSKGVALGLMMINVYGIHSENYDGKTHPFTYDRLIDNLSLCFGNENDKIWGIVVAMFALHLSNKRIQQPTNVHDNFYQCMLSYKKILEKLL